MKFSPIALGLALACTGTAALAQSSVQVFGIIDTGVTHYTGANSLNTVNGDGNTSSRLGFRGTEDLGGGLKAGFWLEAAFDSDNGAGGGATSADNRTGIGSGAFKFGRRSTVSLMGNWGEVRLGRDFVPGFRNLAVTSGGYHAFGTNGVGSSAVLFYPVGATKGVTHVRASNQIAYHLPKNLGGLFGEVSIARGEQVGTSDGNLVGGRIGYAAGPFSVAAAITQTKVAAVDNLTQTNIGGSYDFGVAKAMLLWGENKNGVGQKTRVTAIGAHVPVGPGQVRLSYGTAKATNVGNNADHIALGYVHNLSKRTALYGTYARVKNKNGGNTYVVDGGPAASASGTSTGLQVGIRHAF
ncbi:MAG: porin [Acidovorax sp.]